MKGIHFLKSVKSIISELPSNPETGDRYLMDKIPHLNYIIEYVDGDWVRDPLYPFSGVLVEDKDCAFTYSKHSSHKFKWFKSATVNTLAKIYGTPYSVHQMKETLNLSKGLCEENGRMSISLDSDSCLTFSNPDSQEASIKLSYDSEKFKIKDSELTLKNNYLEKLQYLQDRHQDVIEQNKTNQAILQQLKKLREFVIFNKEMNDDNLNQILLKTREFSHIEYVEDPELEGIDLPIHLSIYENYNQAIKQPKLGRYLTITIDSEELIYGDLFKNPEADFTLIKSDKYLRIIFHQDLEVGSRIEIKGITSTF